jgi:hypothetical protein
MTTGEVMIAASAIGAEKVPVNEATPTTRAAVALIRISRSMVSSSPLDWLLEAER